MLRDVFLHHNGDARLVWFWLALIVGLATGCGSTGATLARASNPSPAVMGTAEGCLMQAKEVFGDADKAAEYCIRHRAMEVARDTTTARAAAEAEKFQPRVCWAGNCGGAYGPYYGGYGYYPGGGGPTLYPWRYSRPPE